MPIRSAFLLAAILLASALPAAADTAPWFNQEWPVRRVVEVKADGVRPGDVGVAAFFSGGQVRPDAGDVRVTVQGRKLVNHKVLQVGPGDLVRVAFEMAPGESRYFIYYGNAKAPAPAAWEPERGVLLEVRRWPGGPAPASLSAAQAAWAKAQPLGADLLDKVAHGFNPFADGGVPTIARYTAYFEPPVGGTYAIAASGAGRSWLLIDGKDVTDARSEIRDARHAVSLPLTPGVHRLDFWNVNPSGTMMTLAAWKAPGSDRFAAIPATAFLPVARAALLETDMQGQKVVADFFAEHAGECWWPDHYGARLRFRNFTKGVSLQAGGRYEWDFGDGQTSALGVPTHLYLAPGDYTVTLKATLGPSSATFKSRVRVERDWRKQADGVTEPLPRCAGEVAQYLFDKLDTANLVLAVDLFDHEGMDKSIASAGAEVILKRQGLDEKTVHAIGMRWGESLRKTDRAADAATAYRQVEARLQAPPHKAEAALAAADTLRRDLYRYDDAEKEYQRVLKAYATSGAEAVLRRAHIGLGDVARHRGDADKARAAYAAAGAIKVVAYGPKEGAVRTGTLARYVEEYTREKEWEWVDKYMDEWEFEFPRDKLDGHLSLLKAAALAAQGKRDAAILEANDLLGANPASAYAVRLLVLAAECHVAKGETDKARLLLQTAAEDYPEDPQQGAAKKRLAELGGPIDAAGKPKRP